MRSTRHRRILCAFVAALLVAACETTQLFDPETGEPTWTSVVPGIATLRAVGATVQLTVVNAMGSPVTVSGLTWRTIESNIVTVDGSGRVTAVTPGTSHVVIANAAHADTVTIEVRQDVATIAISPSTASVAVGATRELVASLRDANAYPVVDRVATWTSAAENIATVSNSGVVTGVAVGSSLISARSGTASGSVTVTVTSVPTPPPPQVANVAVAPATATLTVGQTEQLTATLRDAGGSVLTGRSVTWTTNASAVATVSAAGLVTARAQGAATIAATSEDVSGTATVTVNPTAVTRSLTVNAASGNAGNGTVTGGGLNCTISGTSKSGTCTQSQADGTAAVLTATPTIGYSFGGWGGDCSGTGTCSVTMSAARTVTATFTREQGTAAIYVSPTGSDANPGTQAAPFRTIQKAANLVNPGDVVIVEDGTWTDTDGDGSVVNIDRGGTASAFVTFKARNRWGAKLDGENGRAAQGFDLNNGIGYVRIEGFEIHGIANVGAPRGSASGIDMYDGGHDSQIVGNHIHDIGRVCTNSGNTNGQVGIFVQQPNITVEGNLIHDIGRFFPGENGCVYTGGFTGYQTLDHGMYLNGSSPGASGTKIRNNIFYNTRHGWAVQMYPGSLSNITVVNNTFAFGNPNKSYTHIVLDATISSSMIANNIFYNPEGGKTIEAQGFGGTITISNNITMGSAMTDRSTIPSGMTLANNQLATNPLFVDAPADFRLQAGSPAIDMGLTLSLVTIDFDGRARPRGAAYDIGAHER